MLTLGDIQPSPKGKGSAFQRKHLVAAGLGSIFHADAVFLDREIAHELGFEKGVKIIWGLRFSTGLRPGDVGEKD